VSPIRRVPRLHDLTPAEVSDLFLTVQRVGRMIERVYKATALNIAIQDGPDAGQSVPHVHAHIIPRRPADLPNTDDIYKEMDGPAGDVGQHQDDALRGKFPVVDPDDSRKLRSAEDMNEEAKQLAQEMAREE
jgi:bis(5'-adenosyl)-triphosphatase